MRFDSFVGVTWNCIEILAITDQNSALIGSTILLTFLNNSLFIWDKSWNCISYFSGQKTRWTPNSSAHNAIWTKFWPEKQLRSGIACFVHRIWIFTNSVFVVSESIIGVVKGGVLSEGIFKLISSSWKWTKSLSWTLYFILKSWGTVIWFNFLKMGPNWKYLLGLLCVLLKFIYSEKDTKFCEVFPLLLTGTALYKIKGNIFQNFVTFSEYMNFTCNYCNSNTIFAHVIEDSWKAYDIHQ